MGFAAGEDEERCSAENQGCADEKSLENNELARIDLARRKETDHDSERCAEDAEEGDHPDAHIAVGDLEGAVHVGVFVAQDKASDKHENIHQHVEKRGEGDQGPVRAVDRGHEEKDEREDGHNDGLRDEDVGRHVLRVGFVEEGRQMAVIDGGEEAAAGAHNPGAHHPKGAKSGDRSDEGNGPRHVEGIEEVTEGLHTA